jgi:hypothetical protein
MRCGQPAERKRRCGAVTVGLIGEGQEGQQQFFRTVRVSEPGGPVTNQAKQSGLGVLASGRGEKQGIWMGKGLTCPRSGVASPPAGLFLGARTSESRGSQSPLTGTSTQPLGLPTRPLNLKP